LKTVLDDLTTHLDTHEIEALETMLASWPGAPIVVFHDDRFLGT